MIKKELHEGHTISAIYFLNSQVQWGLSFVILSIQVSSIVNKESDFFKKDMISITPCQKATVIL